MIVVLLVLRTVGHAYAAMFLVLSLVLIAFLHASTRITVEALIFMVRSFYDCQVNHENNEISIPQNYLPHSWCDIALPEGRETSLTEILKPGLRY